MAKRICTTKERLSEMMRELDLTQADIVRRTGIQKGTLSNYLNGKRIPNQEQLSMLSDPYNVNPAWLMGYDLPMFLTSLPNNTNKDSSFETLTIYNDNGKKIGEVKVEDLIATFSNGRFNRIKAYYDAFQNAIQQSPYYEQLQEAKDNFVNSQSYRDFKSQMQQLHERMSRVEKIYRKVGDQKWLLEEEDMGEEIPDVDNEKKKKKA